jgi:hypothetical protein
VFVEGNRFERRGTIVADLTLTPDQFITWHRYARETQSPAEQRECPVCRCLDGLTPWHSLLPWFSSLGLAGIRFETDHFHVPNPPSDLPNRVYHVIAGKGPWV